MNGAGTLPATRRFPNAARSDFLRACLLDGEPGREAFERWLGAVDDPIAGLRSPESSERTLFALLQHTRGRDTQAAPAPFPSLLRAATAHEELRATAIGEAARDVLGTLAAAGVEPLLTGGMALAWGVYASPSLRHCANVDLLVSADAFPAARDALGGLETLAGDDPLRLLHPSGTRIVLHTRLYAESWRATPPGLERESAPLLLAGMPARAICGADLLAQSSTNAIPGLRAIADAYVLCTVAGLDWERARESSALAGAAGPFSELLDRLGAELGVAAPERVHAALARSRQRELARELLVRGPRHARNRLRRAWRQP